MTPLLIQPPAIEPVSLAQMKDYLRLDGTQEDDLVATLITAARLMVEAMSGRMLIDQTWRIVLDGWPAGSILRLPVGPVRQVVAARVFDVAGQPQNVPANALMLEVGSDPPLVRVVASVSQPGRSFAGIEVDVLAGFGATAAQVPAPLLQAIRMLVARWFEQRGDVVAHDAEALPPAIAALLQPWRKVRL
ncbi:MAG: head-tail connector protein [Bosea sp. (in: a-proteobacteria)]